MRSCCQNGNIARMNETSEFADRLSTLLAQRGMTQLELAARIGVTRAAMSRYASGEREPRFVTLVRIAEELGVHVDELVLPTWDAPETALRLVARTSFTDEQKARLRLALDRDGAK